MPGPTFGVMMGVCGALFALSLSGAAGIRVDPTPASFVDWLCNHTPMDALCSLSDSPKDVWSRILHTLLEKSTEYTQSEAGMRSAFAHFHTEDEMADPRLQSWIDSVVTEHLVANQAEQPSGFRPSGKSPYPYFAFIPMSMGSAIPGRDAVGWESRCFKQVRAQASLNGDGSAVTVALEMSGSKGALCSDYYVVATIGHPELRSYFFHGKHSVVIPLVGKSEAERWDIVNNGVRFLMFVDDPIQLFHDIKNSVSLFLQPLTNGHVSAEAEQHNLYFIQHYQGIEPFMQPRNATLYDLPADYIQSGDFIGVFRLDGLDPMLGWAMGSTTGHTVVALRSPSGVLNLCESTTKGSYWPQNGIQCTEYSQWIKYAEAADYNAVLMPLHPDVRARFNETAAWEYFEAVRGVDYGYETLLYGWIDTARGNFPCLPPDFSSKCLSWEFVEMAFSFIEKKIPVAARIFSQAWNHRLNTRGLSIPELYYYAAQHNIRAIDIPRMPEQDGWIYRTTQDGKPVDAPVQVCCVFVCNIWKAAGLFAGIHDNVNCAEQTNFDIYNLKIFDEARMGSNRPEACLKQDPANQLCQLTGKYTLNLNKPNEVQPYEHMHETCPREPPHYDSPEPC